MGGCSQSYRHILLSEAEVFILIGSPPTFWGGFCPFHLRIQYSYSWVNHETICVSTLILVSLMPLQYKSFHCETKQNSATQGTRTSLVSRLDKDMQSGQGIPVQVPSVSITYNVQLFGMPKLKRQQILKSIQTPAHTFFKLLSTGSHNSVHFERLWRPYIGKAKTLAVEYIKF